MIKKAFIYLLLAFSLLLFSKTAFAQDVLSAQNTSTPVDYQLPYPGLLPDHPLYFLKAGRDRLQSFSLSNPIKKAEFNLLQADKRVEASSLLLQKGKSKIDLSQSTFSKAENYFEFAIHNTEEAKMQGVNVTELAKKLLLANTKHRQVLSDMTKQLDKNDRKKFTAEAKRLIDFGQRIKRLTNNK